MKSSITILFVCFWVNFTFSQHAPFVNFTPSQNSYIDLGQGQNLNCFNDLSSSNKLTITLWVKWTNKTDPGVGNWANLITLADSTGSGDNGVFWVQHNSDNTKFEFALHTNARSYIYSTTTPQNNTWYFLTLVYDGSLPNNNLKMYVNGILEASANKTGNVRVFPALSRLNIGRWSNPGNSYRHFNGRMDEISIWKTALTVTQIQNMMISSETVTGTAYNASGLIGYWNFDDNNADDLTTCQNNGTIGGGAGLPVTLVNLTATETNGKVNINWTTAAEINNDFFIVERSQNGIDFENIGKVLGSGNSNVIHTYSFIDENPFSEVSYYRLTQVDYDGESKNFPVISVNIIKANEFALKIYPNPSNGNDVQITGNSDDFTVVMIDISGREVFNSYTSTGMVKIPVAGYKKGVYFIKVVSATNSVSAKFIND